VKKITLFCLALFLSTSAYGQLRALADIKAYNFPPPVTSIHKVVYEYKKGDLIDIKHGKCVDYCQTITPSGKPGWIFEFQTTTNSDIERAFTDYTKAGFEKWDDMYIRVWYSIRGDKYKLDRCALKLAHNIEFDADKDWPAFCNVFQNTRQVQERVIFINKIVTELHPTSKELSKIKSGKLWIGASAEVALASWGSPKDILVTTTSDKVNEQWIYGNNHYVYLTNGLVTGMQN